MDRSAELGVPFGSSWTPALVNRIRNKQEIPTWVCHFFEGTLFKVGLKGHPNFDARPDEIPLEGAKNKEILQEGQAMMDMFWSMSNSWLQ